MIDVMAERERLSKESREVEAQIARLINLLSSDFARKAPAHVVQKEHAKLESYQARVAEINKAFADLSVNAMNENISTRDNADAIK
jgi:valyl-tRNA synthetase